MPKKYPEWFNKEFPDWKKNLIGAFRAFVNGFVGGVASCFLTATADSIVTKEFWIKSLIVGSVAGGLTYTGKWIRDVFYENKYVQKLPI